MCDVQVLAVVALSVDQGKTELVQSPTQQLPVVVSTYTTSGAIRASGCSCVFKYGPAEEASAGRKPKSSGIELKKRAHMCSQARGKSAILPCSPWLSPWLHAQSAFHVVSLVSRHDSHAIGRKIASTMIPWGNCILIARMCFPGCGNNCGSTIIAPQPISYVQAAPPPFSGYYPPRPTAQTAGLIAGAEQYYKPYVDPSEKVPTASEDSGESYRQKHSSTEFGMLLFPFLQVFPWLYRKP